MRKPLASYAPMYCAMYPDLAQLARRHGYALAVHGSLARDFDLICIPWTDIPSAPKAVIDEIISTFAIRMIGEGPERKNHGREAWSLSIGFGDCFLDLSFMPTVNAA